MDVYYVYYNTNKTTHVPTYMYVHVVQGIMHPTLTEGMNIQQRNIHKYYIVYILNHTLIDTCSIIRLHTWSPWLMLAPYLSSISTIPQCPSWLAINRGDTPP